MDISIVMFYQVCSTKFLQERIMTNEKIHYSNLGIVEVLLRLLRRHNISWIRIPEENILKHNKTKELTSSLKLVGEYASKSILLIFVQ